VQNDPLDFCTEGFTTRKPVWTAADVCHLLEQKVRLQGLAPHMRLGHRLDAYRWCDREQLWVCRATRLRDGAPLDIKARRIALATGKHAVPNVPRIPSDGSVRILHSSQGENIYTCVALHLAPFVALRCLWDVESFNNRRLATLINPHRLHPLP
jgi:cation diffusion facilitator CzcD-associated flavoprotein CzcO